MMFNFGKFTASQEIIISQRESYKALFMRDETGQDLVEALRARPHPFYIAVDDAGKIVSMASEPEKIQLPDHDIIGIDETQGFSFGETGNVYGAIWDGNQIIAPPVVMPELSPRQLRLALSRLGKLQDLAIIVASLPHQQREEAEIEWEYATSFRRDHPLIVHFAPILGLSEEETDALWLQAAQIQD